jgi:hypothetical protein
MKRLFEEGKKMSNKLFAVASLLSCAVAFSGCINGTRGDGDLYRRLGVPVEGPRAKVDGSIIPAGRLDNASLVLKSWVHVDSSLCEKIGDFFPNSIILEITVSAEGRIQSVSPLSTEKLLPSNLSESLSEEMKKKWMPIGVFDGRRVDYSARLYLVFVESTAYIRPS